MGDAEGFLLQIAIAIANIEASFGQLSIKISYADAAGIGNGGESIGEITLIWEDGEVFASQSRVYSAISI